MREFELAVRNRLTMKKFRPIKGLCEHCQPRILEDLVVPESIYGMFVAQSISLSSVHLLFHGPEGSGKSTAARVLSKTYEDLYCEEASRNDALPQTFRVGQFASAMRDLGKRKLCLFENVDRLPTEAQLALASHVQRCSKGCNFIITTRHRDRVDDELVRSFHPVSFEGDRDMADLKFALSSSVKRKLWGLGFTLSDRINQLLKENIEAFWPNMQLILKCFLSQLEMDRLHTEAEKEERAERKAARKSARPQRSK